MLRWLPSIGTWTCQYDRRVYMVRMQLGTKSIGAKLISVSTTRKDVAETQHVCDYSDRYDPRNLIGDTNWTLLTEVYGDPVCRWAEGFILSPMELLAQDLTRDEESPDLS